MSRDGDDVLEGQVAVGRVALRWRNTLTVGALALVLVGLAGLDRWFYEHVSCVLETKHNVTDRDFYTLTRPLWIGLRYSMGHLYLPMLLWVVALIRAPRQWQRYTAALAAVVVVALLANVLQGAIGRLRPDQADTHLAFAAPLSQLLSKERVSFPSGEATTALALACMLSLLWPKGRAVFLTAGIVTAAARLVNGAHYLSDVVAGGLLGWYAAALLHARLCGWLGRSETVASTRNEAPA